ncbi:MAG: hypothetical protein ACYS8W_14230 [Planctomycetota bacterium]|jgi:hypothetical protein
MFIYVTVENAANASDSCAQISHWDQYNSLYMQIATIIVAVICIFIAWGLNKRTQWRLLRASIYNEARKTIIEPLLNYVSWITDLQIAAELMAKTLQRIIDKAEGIQSFSPEIDDIDEYRGYLNILEENVFKKDNSYRDWIYAIISNATLFPNIQDLETQAVENHESIIDGVSDICKYVIEWQRQETIKKCREKTVTLYKKVTAQGDKIFEIINATQSRSFGYVKNLEPVDVLAILKEKREKERAKRSGTR